jgi:hypothetical protein
MTGRVVRYGVEGDLPIHRTIEDALRWRVGHLLRQSFEESAHLDDLDALRCALLSLLHEAPLVVHAHDGDLADQEPKARSYSFDALLQILPDVNRAFKALKHADNLHIG